MKTLIIRQGLLLLLVLTVSAPVSGQTIEVKSFGGKSQLIKVNLSEHNVLTVATAKDTVHINNCFRIEEAVQMNNNFAKIVYLERSGSDMHLLRTLVVTSNNDMLSQALHVTSLFTEKFQFRACLGIGLGQKRNEPVSCRRSS